MRKESEGVYQIKIGNMYVSEPKVIQTKVADPYRKFMGFRIGKAPKERNEYEFSHTSFSDEPENLQLPDDILNVIVNGLAEKHEDIQVFQMVPYQIYPEIEEPELELVDIREEDEQ